MDPLKQVDFSRDSTVSIIYSLKNKADIKLIHDDSLICDSSNIFGVISNLKINSLSKADYTLTKSRRINLNKLDCILFRKDPPVDHKYIAELQIFRELQYQKTLVLNSPESLIRFNEKILGCVLSDTKLPTIVSCNKKAIRSFLDLHNCVVLKPINLMGGRGIIKLTKSKDAIEVIDQYIKNYKVIIAQKYLSEIKNGDNRIIIYNGKIEENVLTRYPPKGDFIANLANGGEFKITKIKKKFLPKLKHIASFLKYHGIFFAGVDMIGDHITEINITSPTGVQQIKKGLSRRIATELLKEINNYYV